MLFLTDTARLGDKIGPGRRGDNREGPVKDGRGTDICDVSRAGSDNTAASS